MSDYQRGYAEGCADAKESPDPTWTPIGYGSDYEHGWNDGYNATAPLYRLKGEEG